LGKNSGTLSKCQGFPGEVRLPPPKTAGWSPPSLLRCGNVESKPGPPLPPPGSGPCARQGAPHRQFIHELVTDRLDLLDPATRGPDGQALEWWEWNDGRPVLQLPRCLRSLPTAHCGATVESHLDTCRFWPTTEDVRRNRVALGPDAPAAHAAPPSAPHGDTCRPLAPLRPGIAHHVRGRGAQPRPRPRGVGRGPVPSPAPGHRPDSTRHPGPLRPAARRPRACPLVVCPVRDVVAGPTGNRDVPGRLRPHRGAPTDWPPKLVETPAAGDWQEVPGSPGPAWRGPHRRGYLDPADR